MRSVRGVLQACHPIPTVAVTALATALSVAWSPGDPSRTVLVAVTVLVGQLSIGWCDDATDVGKDVGRTDKPIVTGQVSIRTIRWAAGVAGLVSIPLSLANGPVPGLVHLVVVASGWAYAVVLERTIWSWLPYAVAFGALPTFVHLTLPGAPWPPWWVPVAGALSGVAAHVANVLPDLAEDLAAGVRGWPQRLGSRAAQRVAPWPAVAAIIVLALGPGDPSALDWTGLAVAIIVAAAVTMRPLRGQGTFRTTVILAALGVVLLVR